MSDPFSCGFVLTGTVDAQGKKTGNKLVPREEWEATGRAEPIATSEGGEYVQSPATYLQMLKLAFLHGELAMATELGAADLSIFLSQIQDVRSHPAMKGKTAELMLSCLTQIEEQLRGK